MRACFVRDPSDEHRGMQISPLSTFLHRRPDFLLHVKVLEPPAARPPREGYRDPLAVIGPLSGPVTPTICRLIE